MDESLRVTTELRPSVVLVKVYAWYRFLLALFFLATYSIRLAPDIFGASNPRLYLLIATVHLAATAATLAHLAVRRFHTGTPALFVHLCIDMAALTLLMHSSGGFGSGIGFLVLITVASGSVIFTTQLAMLLAAMASICITLESVVSVTLYDTEVRTIFPAGLLGILLFVTALIFQVLNRRLREAEAVALRQSDQAAHLQQLNEMIIDRMLTGIIVVDVRNRIELINAAATEHLGGRGCSPPLKRGQPLRVIPALWQQIEQWRVHPWRRSPPISTRDGAADIQANFAALDQGNEKRTIIFLEDIRAIAQHAQQMKLASLGKLTGSIAHEIRNPLGAISHASQLLAELAADNTDLTRLTDIIGRHTQRVNQMVENVLQLSRQRAPTFQRLHLRSWLDRFIQDYRDGYRDPVEIQVAVADPNQQVMFDPSHLEQVVTNLVDNAFRYGQVGQDTPWVAIETGIDERTGLPCLDVRDRGTGVDVVDRDHIFDPFFTTSAAGAGLGLYLARELCETNYATLDYIATSTAGGGLFRIGFAHPQRLLPH